MPESEGFIDMQSIFYRFLLSYNSITHGITLLSRYVVLFDYSICTQGCCVWGPRHIFCPLLTIVSRIRWDTPMRKTFFDKGEGLFHGRYGKSHLMIGYSIPTCSLMAVIQNGWVARFLPNVSSKGWGLMVWKGQEERGRCLCVHPQ